jgi:hypothetical protein
MMNSMIDIPIAKKERSIIKANAVLSYTRDSSFCRKFARRISIPRKMKITGQSLKMIS